MKQGSSLLANLLCFQFPHAPFEVVHSSFQR